jgi:hypothetical protein
MEDSRGMPHGVEPRDYTLQIVCPHCTRVTAITEWPASARAPILFTCVTTHGGCGGQALVEPPDVRTVPHLEVAVVTPRPVTPHEAADLATYCWRS